MANISRNCKKCGKQFVSFFESSPTKKGVEAMKKAEEELEGKIKACKHERKKS